MLVRMLPALAPSGMTITSFDISGLPLYNGDVEESSFPEAATALKQAVEASDGVIFATPEYNRSMPGVLKNAIDWASRPWGKNSFAGKPALTMGVSIGKIGTAVAQSHLRQVLAYLDTKLVGQPELYLGPASELFDGEGNLISDQTRQSVTEALVALAKRVG